MNTKERIDAYGKHHETHVGIAGGREEAETLNNFASRDDQAMDFTASLPVQGYIDQERSLISNITTVKDLEVA